MRTIPRLAAALIAVTVGFVAGVCWHAVPPAQADVRESPPREAFKAGSERSVEILGEMSATLKRIETRVERIEQTISREVDRR